MTHDTRQAARAAGDHPLVDGLARLGYAVNGVLHLLIAWITGQVALGSSGEADQSGALAYVRDAPGGALMLWIAVIGFAALALWQLLEAAVGAHGGDDRQRAMERGKALAKGAVYLALAFTSWQFARGGSSDSGERSADFTARIMQAPAGMWLVVLAGVAVAAVGGYHIYKGATKKFLQDLKGNASGDLGQGVVYAGRSGYIAKGAALIVVGGVFVTAALGQQPEEATGLDGAVKQLADQPYGTVLLLLVAVGLAAYGIYSLARAKYARM